MYLAASSANDVWEREGSSSKRSLRDNRGALVRDQPCQCGGGAGYGRGRGCEVKGPGHRIPPSSSRPKGTMVTYGGMAKQPVMVPVVSTGDALDFARGMSPAFHCPCPLSCRSALQELGSPLPADGEPPTFFLFN